MYNDITNTQDNNSMQKYNNIIKKSIQHKSKDCITNLFLWLLPLLEPLLLLEPKLLSLASHASSPNLAGWLISHGGCYHSQKSTSLSFVLLLSKLVHPLLISRGGGLCGQCLHFPCGGGYSSQAVVMASCKG